MSAFRLFRFLFRNARRTVLLMVLAGALAGLFSAGVLALVSRAAVGVDAMSRWLIVGFVALAAGKIISNAAAQLLLVRFSQETTLELSLTLCAKVLNAPFRVVEQRGSASILAVLTDDVSSLTWAVQVMPQLAMNLAVMLGCAIYLAWLSWPMFLGVLIVGILGTLVYKALHTHAFSRIHAARESRALLFHHFRSLTTGIKELMMHRARRTALLEQEIRPAADAYREHNLAATTHYVLAESWVQILYHGLVGLVLFAFPLFTHPTPATLTGYVFAMLYMMTPMWGVVGSLPTLARGQVALDKIEELGVSIDMAVAEDGEAERIGASASEPGDSTSPMHGAVVDLRGIVFTYNGPDDSADTKIPAAESEHAFTLGPIDFRLAPGELVFVVGGNGSGKSTFVKILTGLYTPHAGTLRIDDLLVTDATREWYREHFSVVFADCFVFDKLLGLTTPDVAATARRYLELLQIDHKVSVRTTARGSEFSTIDLSTGQRKRLALVTAYLEDRPFYVFDEWAADQDPEYKKIFYTKLLPDLRARGKAVVVITHDDRYFHLGDRVVKLEDGKVVAYADERVLDAHASTTPAGV
jgi:putative ATP-binding cassette transporter